MQAKSPSPGDRQRWRPLFLTGPYPWVQTAPDAFLGLRVREEISVALLRLRTWQKAGVWDALSPEAVGEAERCREDRLVQGRG